MDRYCCSVLADRSLFSTLGIFPGSAKGLHGFFFRKECVWPAGEDIGIFQRYRHHPLPHSEDLGQASQYIRRCVDHCIRDQVFSALHSLLQRYLPG